MESTCIVKKNNLYDSVLNEVEKSADYVAKLNKFTYGDSIEKMKLADFEIAGFLQMKSNEIMVDRLLRAFINISHAFDRCYNSVLSDLSNEQNAVGKFKPDVFYEIYRKIDDILKLRSTRRLYKEEFNRELVRRSAVSFIGYCEGNFQHFMDSLDEKKDSEYQIVSIPELREATDRCYGRVSRFLGVMRSEIETRTEFREADIIMKDTIMIIIDCALAASTVMIS